MKSTPWALQQNHQGYVTADAGVRDTRFKCGLASQKPEVAKSGCFHFYRGSPLHPMGGATRQNHPSRKTELALAKLASYDSIHLDRGIVILDSLQKPACPERKCAPRGSGTEQAPCSTVAQML